MSIIHPAISCVLMASVRPHYNCEIHVTFVAILAAKSHNISKYCVHHSFIEYGVTVCVCVCVCVVWLQQVTSVKSSVTALNESLSHEVDSLWANVTMVSQLVI